MNIHEAIELKGAPKRGTSASTNVSDKNESASMKIDPVVDAQTRTRSLFSTGQLFAYSLTYMSVWEALCGNIYYALTMAVRILLYGAL